VKWNVIPGEAETKQRARAGMPGGFSAGETGFAHARGNRSRLPYRSGDLGAHRFRIVLESHHELLGKTPLGTIEGAEKLLAPSPLGMFSGGSDPCAVCDEQNDAN
jgi:hypothetical protein